MKISKIGAMLSFSVFWPALLARGFSIRIILPSYMELDQPIRMLSPSPTTHLLDWPFFLARIHPMYKVDSLTKNTFPSI
jgi:hypothetical protein